MPSIVSAADTSLSGRCVVASATRSGRSPVPASIITTRGVLRALGEIFGVAGEGNAGVVDRALLQRRGDDGVETAGQRAVDRGVEQAEHVAPVGGVELARLRQARRARDARSRLARRAALGQPTHRARACEQRAIAEHGEARRRPARRAPAERRRRQFGTDAGRLAGGDRDGRAAGRRRRRCHALLVLLGSDALVLHVRGVAQFAQPVGIRLLGLALADRLTRDVELLRAEPSASRRPSTWIR